MELTTSSNHGIPCQRVPEVIRLLTKGCPEPEDGRDLRHEATLEWSQCVPCNLELDLEDNSRATGIVQLSRGYPLGLGVLFLEPGYCAMLLTTKPLIKIDTEIKCLPSNMVSVDEPQHAWLATELQQHTVTLSFRPCHCYQGTPQALTG